MSFWTAVAVTMVVPSSSTMMSPAWMPARSAGLPSTTVATCIPVGEPTFAATLGGSAIVLPAMPSQARRTRPVVIRVVTISRVVVVDRDGEAEADPRHRGVDADHPAVVVGEDAAAVAGVERGVGLDDLVDDPAGRRRAASGRGPTRCRP